MERAGKFISKLPSCLNGICDEDLARSAWKLAVGKRIASHSGEIWLIRDRLVIEVEDAVWQRQLFALRNQILANIEDATGRKIVAQLEFRIAPKKFAPQRALTASPTLTAAGAEPDDADCIQDPVMRRIYRASRRRATA